MSWIIPMALAVAFGFHPAPVLAVEQLPAAEAVADEQPVWLATLQDAVDESARLQADGKLADARTLLAQQIKAAALTLDAASDPARTLLRALDESSEKAGDEDALDRLQGGVAEAVVAAKFKPIMEAPLPEGYPEPGPVGAVVVKEYPAYRLARTPMSNRDEGKSFWTLFQHIKQSNIAMTAPVEMEYTKAGGAMKPASMAFLYRSVKQGEAGQDGDVDVFDVPAMTVLSIGLRGGYNDERVADAVTSLEAWLKEHPEYKASGEVRLLGYNSPMILPFAQFAEVQLPVTLQATKQPPQP